MKIKHIFISQQLIRHITYRSALYVLGLVCAFWLLVTPMGCHKRDAQTNEVQAPTAAELELQSVPADLPFNYLEQKTTKGSKTVAAKTDIKQFTDEEKQKLLDEVEKQQTEFGTTK